MFSVRKVTAVIFAAMGAWLALSPATYAAPPSPLVITLRQPDGSTFQARQWGDEWSNGVETMDGYTVVRDAQTGNWVYASRSSNGTIVPTTGAGGAKLLVVGRNAPTDLPKHVRPASKRPVKSPALANPRAPGRPSVSVGTQHVLVILVQFTNQSAVGTNESDWSDRFFGTSGTAKQYYSEVSYGQLTLAPAPESYDTVNDGIVGWLTLSYDHPDTGEYVDDRNRQIAKDAILAAEPYVEYHTFDPNHDGFISDNELHIVVVVAGYEEAFAGPDSCSPSVWAHDWSFDGSGGSVPAPVVDNVTVGLGSQGGGYIEMGEYHCGDGYNHPATIGIPAHELGHGLGLPDLYDTTGTTAGIGFWGLMGDGVWNSPSGDDNFGDTPAQQDAWSKWFEGWITPVRILGPSHRQAIPQVETNPTVYQFLDNPNGVDWGSGSGTGEYFLVENRQPVGFDVALPGCGLLIWHIDESEPDNDEPSHRLVDLEQADGLNQLDIPFVSGGNTGDAGDPFPGSTTNRNFSGSTNPSSNLYSGSRSGVIVSGISNCSSAMQADFQAYYLIFPLMLKNSLP